ncbi:MAG: enoyl-CoA hydratase/isomerase family protein, partial [Desulfobacterales bacterium]|nr:enoyl-CoA hydratase/isomerase family protein [Desulfobacterales bacterium]
MEAKVRMAKENEVVVITLNRPGVYNALDQELLELLAERLLDVSLDQTARTVAIAGAGKAFCAGGDLKSV